MSRNTQTTGVRALSTEEIDHVSGGNILIYGLPVVGGFMLGTAIRKGVDALVDWIFG
jgi:hypothetical protein